jgi:hypothetical protein
VVEVYWLREAAAALSYDTRGNRDQALANGSPLDHKPKDRPGSSSDKTNLFPALRLFQVVSGLVVQDHRTGTGHSVRVGRSESAGLFGVVLQAVSGILGGVVVLGRVGLDGKGYRGKNRPSRGFVSEGRVRWLERRIGGLTLLVVLLVFRHRNRSFEFAKVYKL